jgi:hypothetical protein
MFDQLTLGMSSFDTPGTRGAKPDPTITLVRLNFGNPNGQDEEDDDIEASGCALI